MEQGLIDATLCEHVFKKRVASHGQGKCGGSRTLLAYQSKDKAFFIFGFAKNERTNINAGELKTLKRYARELLGYSDVELKDALKAKILIEVYNDE